MKALGKPIILTFLLVIFIFLGIKTNLYLYAQSLLPGDANGDGRVDLKDVLIWAVRYNQQSENGTRGGDFDSNDLVNNLDFGQWLKNRHREMAMYRADPQHTGVYHTKAVPNFNSLKWQIKPGDWGVASPPVVAGDTVYFGGFDDYLYAVDAQTGQEKWRYQTQDSVDYSPLVADGIVYFGDYKGYLYAVDTNTQQEKWRFKTKTDKPNLSVPVQGRVTSSSVLAYGLIYFADDSGRLYALDAQTGEEVWEIQDPLAFRVTLPAINDSVAYFASDYGVVYAVDALTGQEKWRHQFQNASIYSISIPVTGHDLVYLPGSDGVLYALDTQTGSRVWQFKYEPENQVHFVAPYPIAITDEAVYLSGTNDEILNVLDPLTGEEKWQFQAESWLESSPSIADGMVYFGTYDRPGDHHGYLYAVNIQTREEKWKFKIDDLGIKLPPVIVDGVVYFTDGDGFAYALE